MPEWKWGSVDEGRAARALKVKLSSVDLSADPPSAVCVGSAAAPYVCTLDSCTCKDFTVQAAKGSPAPCKHIIRLAMDLNLLDRQGRTAAQRADEEFASLESRLAMHAWRYYVLHSPDIPDSEYDSMKSRYLDLLQRRTAR
jgi:predicted nucleic acid-binding Zn finger protein